MKKAIIDWIIDTLKDMGWALLVVSAYGLPVVLKEIFNFF